MCGCGHARGQFQQVADGVLASANKTLMEGGLIDTPMTWDNYEAVIDEEIGRAHV